MPDPIRNTERAELRKVPVVEAQYKMCFFIAYVLQRMTVALRKVPDVTRPKNVRGRLAIRSDDCREHGSPNDVSPLGGDGVPM